MSYHKHTWKLDRLFSVFWSIIVPCIVLSACLYPKVPPEVSRVFRMLIDPSDLSPGWSRDGAHIEEVEGAIARARIFQGPPGTERHAVVAAHRIFAYDSIEKATTAYPELEMYWFPTADWVPPTKLSYESPIADQFRIGCASAVVNGVSTETCAALWRYEDVISIFNANVFQDRWFTWEDMEHVLKAIDERMAAEMQ